MSIYLTITAAAGNEVQQSEISSSLSKSLTVSAIQDTEAGALNVNDFNYAWYFIDKPSDSSVSIDETNSPSNKSVILLNSIDTWGTYRIFVVATNASTSAASEDNPLRADERNFINITVKSTNNSLEKPASFQRNWKEKYDKLVDIVDSTEKSINKIKISNSLTFNLPSTDGTEGQILKTDGSGNLSFDSVSSSELSNVSLESLTNVSNNSPTDGQVLAWDSSINSWKPDTITSTSSGITLESLSVGTPASATTTGGISYDNSTGVFTYFPPDLSSFLTSGSFSLVNDTTPQLGGDLNGQAFNITTTGKILFSNVYATEDALPLAETYHGMFAHVHATGKAYFAHGGNWIPLIAETGSSTDNLPEGSSNLYFTNQRADTRASIIATQQITAAQLRNIGNVYIPANTDPADGQVLKWDSTQSRWYAGNDNSSSGSTGISLSDISMATPGAASGSGSLAYDNTNGEFTYTPPDLSSYLTSIEISNDTTPQLGGNLDVNGNDIISSTTNQSINLAPNGTGSVTIRGNSTGGSGHIKLNCENNSHGIIIKGPPHSASATYTLTLPNDDGSPDQVLKTNGSGILSWVDQSASNAISGLSSSGTDLIIDSSYTLTPASSDTVDIGSVGYAFKDLYLTGTIETSEITMFGENHIYCLPKDGIDPTIDAGFYVLKHNLDSGQNTSFSTISYSNILNTPSLSTVATSGAYSDLTGTPSLSDVATSGAYSDLTGAPSLSTVATSGSYNDLSNKPTIPSGTAASLDVGTSANNVVQLDNSGRLPAIDGSQLTGISAGSSSTDNISEGNAKVETVDTGSDGSVDFYTEVSSDNSVFSSVPSPVWKMDKDGNLTPGKNDTFNLGFYSSTGSATDNRQISKIHVDKIYSNGNYFRIPPAMSSSDFKLTAVQDTMSSTYDIPFYASDVTPSNSSTGHIIVKNLSESYGPHDWTAWKIKLPAVFSSNSNSVLVSNSSIDQFTWEKTDLYKISEWSNTHSGEWTTSTSYSSSYSGSSGKSIFILAFKNITGKTINITKASLSCLEMYSTKIYWTLVGATDSEFKQNQAVSIAAQQLIEKVNVENSSPYSGIGQSETDDISGTINNGNWTAFLITAFVADTNKSSVDNDKNFVANLTYTLS